MAGTTQELALYPSSASVGAAREVVARFAFDQGLSSSMVELLRLAVSELVTNALVHGAAPFGLRLESEPTLLRITVSDASSREPEPARAAIADSHGRGLTIIQRIADDFGWTLYPGEGKGVWFTVLRRRRG